MHLNRMFLAKVFALSMTLWSLPSTGFSQDSDSCDQQLLRYCRGDGETYQEAKGYMECLRRNRNKFSGECGAYIDEMLGEFERSQPCLEDYLKLCGIDLVRMQIRELRQSEEEKVHECRILKWDEFSAGCRQEYQDSMEALGWDDEAIRKEAARLKAREKTRGPVKVSGTGKTIIAEAREGDLIWYKVTVREKKVLDRYPFCPEVKGKGLEVVDAVNMGICYYDVTASWGQELLEKLKKADVLKNIPDWGGGLREYSWKLTPKEDSFLSAQEHENLVTALSLVVNILDQYSNYCPEDFETEVGFKRKVINNVSQPIGYSAVTCERRDYNACREGYIKSYYDYGYFGCVKYASCEETNPKYIKAGDGCVECDAGGCVDYERWAELRVGAVCKVNYKDPTKTPPCDPYRITRTYYPNGTVSTELFYRSELIKSHQYDSKGELESVIEYKNGDIVKAFSADGTPKDEIIRKTYTSGKNGRTYPSPLIADESIYNLKTKESTRIKEYAYDESGKLIEERFYNETGELVRSYDESGQLKEELLYDRSGDLIKRHMYDRDRNIKTIYEFEGSVRQKLTRVQEHAYDESGKLKEERFYNGDQDLIKKNVYGGDGNIEETHEYGSGRQDCEDKPIRQEIIDTREGDWFGEAWYKWNITTKYDHDGKIIFRMKTFLNPAQGGVNSTCCYEGVCP